MSKTYVTETSSYEHGLPFLGRALIAFADVRDSTALSKRLGPVRFYEQIVRPLYEIWRKASDGMARALPGWHCHGPKWAGDGALLVFVAPHGRIIKISDYRRFVEYLTTWGYLAADSTRNRGGPNIGVAIGVHRGTVLIAREPSTILPSGQKVAPIVTEEVIGYAVNRAAKLSKGLGDPSSRFFWGLRVVVGRGIEERTIRSIARRRFKWVREGSCLVCRLSLP